MVTQAQVVMTHTVAVTSFIKPDQYNGEDTLKGLMAEGGALWTEAQIKFPGCVWVQEFRHILFEDGSKIMFISAPDSMFEMTYKAVES